MLLVLCFNLYGYGACEIYGPGAFYLNDLYAPFLRDIRGVDEIYILVHDLIQDPLYTGDGYRRDIEGADVPAVFNGNLLGCAFQCLPLEASEFFREFNVRAEDREEFRRDARHIDSVPYSALCKVIGHLFGNRHRHLFLRLNGGCAEMGGKYDAVQRKKGVILRRGLLITNIQRRAASQPFFFCKGYQGLQALSRVYPPPLWRCRGHRL